MTFIEVAADELFAAIVRRRLRTEGGGFRFSPQGVPKQHMAGVSALMTPLNMVLPVMVAKWTGGSRPMHALSSTYPMRAVLRWDASSHRT